MNPNRPKRVIRVREQKHVLPKILPPMERPQTPRLDVRSASGARPSNLQNLSISRFADLPELGVSAFEQVTEILNSAKSVADLVEGVKSFADISVSLAHTGQFAGCDLTAYHKLYPHLQSLVDSAPGDVLHVLVLGLENCVKAIQASHTVKTKPVSPPSVKAISRMQKLAPLKEPGDAPASPPSPERHETIREAKHNPIEHFYQFMAKILYKMSSNKENDKYFDDNEMVMLMIELTKRAHKIDTRTYSVAALKNEAHSQSFRQRVVAASTFSEIFDVLNSETKKPQLLIQCTGLLRNLILDAENVDALVGNRVHVLLFRCLKRFPESPELVFNCFRILTKISERDEVRSSILQLFGVENVLGQFIDLMVRHQSNHPVVLRIAYVFADFAAYEQSLLQVAGNCSNLSQIPVLLEDPEFQKDREVAAMVVQVIANMSVDSKCASLLSACPVVATMYTSCTFDEKDRLGLNLLCCASNFTCHNHKWSPPELITAIPKAIVSKYIPSILESLRTLCNLALSPNPLLISSKTPELLAILLKHVNDDVVLYSLQTLANLVSQAEMKQRFRAAGCLDTILELLDSDEIDVMELEAIAAVIMNFGTLEADEARAFSQAIEQYETNDSDDIINTFKAYLKKQLLVDS